MPYLNVRDLRLYHEISGDGDAVLFISGTGGDLRVRPGIFDSPLAQAFRVLAYDQRGLGRTSIPSHQPTMADYAQDAAALLEALDVAPVCVVGVSFGGMVAQELAIRYPEHVRALVLCCTSSGGEGGSSYPLHELADMEGEARRRIQLSISDVRMDAAWQESNPERTAALLKQLEERAAVGTSEPGRARGAALQLEARRTHDAWHRLPRIGVPVRIAAGRYDGIAPPANSEALSGRIPGAELTMHEGGHMFLVQDKQAWPSIVDWIRKTA